MSNFSGEIFFGKILQLWLNENVWNYYIHQKECGGQSIKQTDTFEILNSWNTVNYFSIFVGILVLCTLNSLSPAFLVINNNNLSFFCLKDIKKM